MQQTNQKESGNRLLFYTKGGCPWAFFASTWMALFSIIRTYIIDRKLRWDLRDILDQLNMNERMIYPGMDGIAKWLARHYYVKR